MQDYKKEYDEVLKGVPTIEEALKIIKKQDKLRNKDKKNN